MFRNYLKIAIRNLLKNKVYSFINITGLAIGLAAAMLILLYTKDEVSYDQFHANNPNIYRIYNEWLNPDGSIKSKDGNTGNVQGAIFAQNIPEIKCFVRVQGAFNDIRTKNEIKGYQMLAVDSNFFSVFTFPLVFGDSKTALDNPKSIIISEKMALQFFNSTAVVNKTIELKEGDSFVPYKITAVSQNVPQNSSMKFDFLLPKIVDKAEYSDKENWFNFFQNTFVLLHSGANPQKVDAKMKQVYDKDAKRAAEIVAVKYGIKEKLNYHLQPMTDMHLSVDLAAQNGLSDASNPVFSYILSGIALFLLLIACINFVNLTMARSVKRVKEIGVRKVIGGGRRDLIFQFLGESFTLSFIAFILAILIVSLVLPFFNQLANKSLSLSYLLDGKLIITYFALFLITSLLAGFYPSFVLSGYNPVDTLYNRFQFSGKNYLQKSLVVLQFSLASFLIIATLTIFSQFNFLINKDLGYNDKDVVLVNNFGMGRAKANEYKNQLLKNPNIVQVGVKNGGGWGTVAKVNGENQIQFAYETVDEDYLPLYKIPLIEGRNFSKEFPSDSAQSVIVNEEFVKQANWKKPIGQIVDFFVDNHKYSVIGVVKNYHFDGLSQKIRPQVFTMKHDNPIGMVNIKIKPNSETASLKHIEATFKSNFPISPFSYQFKNEANKANYESEAKWKQIMLFGAILTIFISCIGLFGLATLSAEKRTKEIGVRKVLGASVVNIVTLLSTDFVKLVSISLLFSFPIAYYATQKWLENYPFREGFNVWIFVFTALITIIIALITVSYQAVRAALANPVKSLRTE